MFFKIQPVDGTSPKRDEKIVLRKSQSCYGTQRPVKKITLAEYPKEFLNLKSDLCSNTKKHLEPEGFFYAHVRIGNPACRDKYDGLKISESTSLSFYTAKNSPLKIINDKSSENYIENRSRHRNNSILKRTTSVSDSDDVDVDDKPTERDVKVKNKPSIFRTIVDSFTSRTVGGADERKGKSSKISFAAQAEYICHCSHCSSSKSTETETPDKICEETNTEQPLYSAIEDLQSFISGHSSRDKSELKKRKLAEILKSGTSKEPKILVPRSSIKYVEIFDDTDSTNSKMSCVFGENPNICIAKDSKTIICSKLSRTTCHDPVKEAPIKNFFRNLIRNTGISDDTQKTVCVSWKPCDAKSVTNTNEKYIQCPRISPVNEPIFVKEKAPILYPLEKDSLRRDSKTRTLFTPAEPFGEDSCDEEGGRFFDIIKSRKPKKCKIPPLQATCSKSSNICVADTKGCSNTDDTFVVCPTGSKDCVSSKRSHKTQTRPRLKSADVAECDPEANEKHRKLLEKKTSSAKSEESYKSVCVANECDIPICPSLCNEKFVVCKRRSCRNSNKSKKIKAKQKATTKKSHDSVESTCVANEADLPYSTSENKEFIVCPKKSSNVCVVDTPGCTNTDKTFVVCPKGSNDNVSSKCCHKKQTRLILKSADVTECDKSSESSEKGTCQSTKSNQSIKSICVPKGDLPCCSSKNVKYSECPNQPRENISCSVAKESAYGTLSASKTSSDDPTPIDILKEKLCTKLDKHKTSKESVKFVCVRKVTDKTNFTGSERYIKCPYACGQEKDGLENLLRTSSTNILEEKPLPKDHRVAEKSVKKNPVFDEDRNKDEKDLGESYPEVIMIADTPSLYVSPGESFMETPSLYLSPDISKMAVKRGKRESSISIEIPKKKKRRGCVSNMQDKKKFESESEEVQLCENRKQSPLDFVNGYKSSSITSRLYKNTQGSKLVPKGTYVCVNKQEDKKLYQPGVHVATCSRACKEKPKARDKRIKSQDSKKTEPVVLYEAPEKPLENEEDIEDSNFEVFCRPSPVKDDVQHDKKKREKAHSYTPSPVKHAQNSTSSHRPEAQKPILSPSVSIEDAVSYESHRLDRKKSPVKKRSGPRVFKKKSEDSTRNINDKSPKMSFSCVCNTWKQPTKSSDSLVYDQGRSERQSTNDDRPSRKKSKSSWDSFKRKFKEKLQKCCRSKSRGKPKDSQDQEISKHKQSRPTPKRFKGKAPEPPVKNDPRSRKPPRSDSTGRTPCNNETCVPPSSESPVHPMHKLESEERVAPRNKSPECSTCKIKSDTSVYGSSISKESFERTTKKKSKRSVSKKKSTKSFSDSSLSKETPDQTPPQTVEFLAPCRAPSKKKSEISVYDSTPSKESLVGTSPRKTSTESRQSPLKKKSDKSMSSRSSSSESFERTPRKKKSATKKKSSDKTPSRKWSCCTCRSNDSGPSKKDRKLKKDTSGDYKSKKNSTPRKYTCDPACSGILRSSLEPNSPIKVPIRTTSARDEKTQKKESKDLFRKSKSKDSVNECSECSSYNTEVSNKNIDLSLSCDSSSVRSFQENEAIYFQTDENGFVESPAVFKKKVDKTCLICGSVNCKSYCKNVKERKTPDKERKDGQKSHKRNRTPESNDGSNDNKSPKKKSSKDKKSKKDSKSGSRKGKTSSTRMKEHSEDEKEGDAIEQYVGQNATIDHKNRLVYIDCPNYLRCAKDSFTNCPNQLIPKRGKKDLLKSKFVRQSSIAKILFDTASKSRYVCKGKTKSKSRLRSGSTCKCSTSKKAIKATRNQKASAKIIQKHSVQSIASSCAYFSFKSCSSGCPNMCSSGSLFGNSCPFAYVNKSNQSFRLHSGANKRNSKTKRSKDCLCDDSFSREKFIGHQKPTLQSVKIKKDQRNQGVKKKLSKVSNGSTKYNESSENSYSPQRQNRSSSQSKYKNKCGMLDQVSDINNGRSTRNRLTKGPCSDNCSFDCYFAQSRGQVRSGHGMKNNNDKSKASLAERLKGLLRSTSSKRPSRESLTPTKEYKSDNVVSPRKKWKDNKTSNTSDCSEECEESCIFINTDFHTRNSSPKKQKKDCKTKKYKTSSKSSLQSNKYGDFIACPKLKKKSNQQISKTARSNSSYGEFLEPSDYLRIDECRCPKRKSPEKQPVKKDKNKLDDKIPSARLSKYDNCKCALEEKESELISKIDYNEPYGGDSVKKLQKNDSSSRTTLFSRKYNEVDSKKNTKSLKSRTKLSTSSMSCDDASCPYKNNESGYQSRKKNHKETKSDDNYSPYKNKDDLSKKKPDKPQYEQIKPNEYELKVRPTTSPIKCKPASDSYRSSHKTSPILSSRKKSPSCSTISFKSESQPKAESHVKIICTKDMDTLLKMNFSDDIHYKSKCPTKKKSSKKIPKPNYTDDIPLKNEKPAKKKSSKKISKASTLCFCDDFPLKSKYSSIQRSSPENTSIDNAPTPKKEQRQRNSTQRCCYICDKCSFEFIKEPSNNSDDLQNVYITKVPEKFVNASSSLFSKDLYDPCSSEICSRDTCPQKLPNSNNTSEATNQSDNSMPPYKIICPSKKSNLSPKKDKTKKKSNVTVRDSTPSHRSFYQESPPADLSPPRSPQSNTFLNTNEPTPFQSEHSISCIRQYRTFCITPENVRSGKIDISELSVHGCLCNSFVTYKNSTSLKKLFEKNSPAPSVEEDESASKVISTISDDSFLVRKSEKYSLEEKIPCSNESTQEPTLKSKYSSMSSMAKKCCKAEVVPPIDYKEFIKSIDNYLKCKMDIRESAGKQSPSPMSQEVPGSYQILTRPTNCDQSWVHKNIQVIGKKPKLDKKKPPKKIQNNFQQVRCIKACSPAEKTNVGIQAKCPRRQTKARILRPKGPTTKTPHLIDMSKISTDLLQRKLQMSKNIEKQLSTVKFNEGSINLKGGYELYPNVCSPKSRKCNRIRQPKKSLLSIPSVNTKISSKPKCRKSCRPVKFDKASTPLNAQQFIWDEEQHHLRYVKKVPSKNKRDISTTMSKKDDLASKSPCILKKLTCGSMVIDPCFSKVDSIICDDSGIEEPKISRPFTSPTDKFCEPRNKCGTPVQCPMENSCNSSVTKKSSTLSCYANKVTGKCCGVCKKKPSVVRQVIYPKWTEPKPGPGLIQYKDRLSSFACADLVSQKGVDYSEKLLDLVKKKKKEIEQLRVKLDRASKKYGSITSRQISLDDSKEGSENKTSDLERASFTKSATVNPKKISNPTSRPISQRMSFVDDPPYCSMSNFLSDVNYKNMKGIAMESLDGPKALKKNEYYCRGLLPRWIYKQNTKSDDNEL